MGHFNSKCQDKQPKLSKGGEKVNHMSEQQDWHPAVKWLTYVLDGLAAFMEKIAQAQQETNITASADMTEIWTKTLPKLLNEMTKTEFTSIAALAYTLGRLNSLDVKTATPEQLLEIAKESRKSSEILKGLLTRT